MRCFLCCGFWLTIVGGISAISADATLCMQKDGEDWGVYSSLPKAIEVFKTTYTSEAQPQSITSGPTPSSSSSSFHPRRLTFAVYFSSSDVMIGKGGQQYFENCWKQGNADEKIEYKARTVPESDHDSIILPEKGWIKEVFGQVKKVCG